MRQAPASPWRRPAALRSAFACVVAACLAAGIGGGLVRAGVALPAWMGPAIAAHALLMICAVMGTVIGIERAVAVKHPLAFAGPFASAAAGIAVLAGAPQLAAGLAAAASLAFVGVSIAIVRRQPAAHTALLLAAAAAWAAGCLLHALGRLPGAVVPLWFCFLVFTIAAERLEMTRLMRRHAGAGPALVAILAAMAGGAVGSGVVYGLSLATLAAWLAVFDIARRTVRTHGLSRYMALCLLPGYAWLAVAGLAWAATSLGRPLQDVALHALALGFVFSMVFGHAPVILPAVARVKLQFGRLFYVPLLLLHASLLLRFAGGLAGPRWTAIGAAGNAAAIALFALTLAASAIAWRARHAPRTRSSSHDPLAEN